jgi:uncharacterized protein (DUF302 family)
MTYSFDTIVDKPFDETIILVTEALKLEGFGILTDIDVQATMKKKLDVDMDPYRILGACNPQFAYQAMKYEPKIGTMLPCNVIVRQIEPGKNEVSAIDPIASMQAIDNPALKEIADTVQDKMKKVIASLPAVK